MAQNTEVATDRPVNRQMESDQSENGQRVIGGRRAA